MTNPHNPNASKYGELMRALGRASMAKRTPEQRKALSAKAHAAKAAKKQQSK